MIDVSVIQERLQALESYTERLNTLKQISLNDYTADIEKQWAVERGLLLAIECVLDVASHLIAALSLKKPSDYTEALLLLGEEKIVPIEFAKRISGMAGFRNLLIHEYLKTDPQKVYERLQSGPDDFAAFTEYTIGYLQTKGYVERSI